MEGFVHKSDNWFAQLDTHEAILPPSPIPFPFVLHAAGARLDFPGGHVFADSVRADGQRIACGGHTASKIPHYNIGPPWPPNVLLPIIIWFSESKCSFSAARVQACGNPVAMAILRTVGVNLACNDPLSLPTSRVYTGGTVLVGFTMGDVLAGLGSMAQDMLISAVTNFLGGKVGDALGDPAGEALEETVEEVFGEGVEDGVEGLAEDLLGEHAEEIVEGTLGSAIGNQTSDSMSEALSGGDE